MEKTFRYRDCEITCSQSPNGTYFIMWFIDDDSDDINVDFLESDFIHINDAIEFAQRMVDLPDNERVMAMRMHLEGGSL